MAAFGAEGLFFGLRAEEGLSVLIIIYPL